MNMYSAKTNHGTHYTQVICENGHRLTTGKEIGALPGGGKFCPTCGASTLDACPACQAPIPGNERDAMTLSAPAIPNNCMSCGAKMPWFVRALENTKEWAEAQEKLSAEERAAVVKDVEDIIKHAPREGIATQKLRAVMKKVGFQAANVLSSALGGALGEQSRIVIFGP
jgi:hypothetical protein